MEDKNIDIKVTVETNQAVKNLDNLKKSADKAEGSVKKVSKAGKDVSKDTGKSISVAKDVGEAWEQAFENASEALGSTGESLRKIFAAVKSAIPVVKSLNSTAVSGLKKVKAAIISSGVGILILALGEVIAHWQDITKWLGIGKKAQEEYNRTVEDTKNRLEDLDLEQDKERAKLEAQGATQEELAQFDIEASQKRLDKLKEITQETENNHKLKKKDRKEQLKSLSEEQEAEEHNLKILKSKLETVKEVAEINEENARKAEEEEKRREEEEAAEQARLERLERLQQLRADLQSASNNASDTLKKLAEHEKNGLLKSTGGFFTKLLDPKTATKSTDEVVAYIEMAFKELNRKLGTDLKITTGLYEGLLEGDKFSFNLQQKEINSERERLFAEGRITLEESLELELRIKKKAYEKERELLIKRKEFLEENGSGQELEKVKSDLKILDDEIATFQINQNARIAKAAADAKAKMDADSAAIREANLEAIEKELESKRKKLESKYIAEDRALKGEEFDTSFRRGLFKRSREYEQNQIAQIESLMNYYGELYALETDPDAKLSILENLQDLETQKTQIEREGLEERKQLRLEEVQSYMDAANSIADIFGTVAQLEEERIQRQLDAGDIGIEAAKSQFETVKQWQYAQTWINTIAGMTAALTSPILNSTPGGWVAASAQAASLLATGIAQTIKIKNTDFNGGGVSSGGSGITASPSVTPIDVRNDIQQSPTVLPDSQSPRNQRVYILERDIQDSNRRVEIRENNSTF